MKVSELRKIFGLRPYKPLEIVLDNGLRYVVPHPEAVLISDDLVACVPPGHSGPEFMAPEAISTVRPASRKNGGKSTSSRG